MLDNAFYDDIDLKEFFIYGAEVGSSTDDDHLL